MKTIKSILTIVLSGYLILAMGGFSVFHHLCNCSSEAISNTSILVEQSCCSSDAINSTSCHSESNTCGEDGCEDFCCKTEVEALAITESLIVENIRLTSPSIFLINIFNTVQDVDNSVTDSKPLTSFKDLSPPRPGKSIVIFNQCLKIPFRT